MVYLARKPRKARGGDSQHLRAIGLPLNPGECGLLQSIRTGAGPFHYDRMTTRFCPESRRTQACL
jgi:hypothetical protein